MQLRGRPLKLTAEQYVKAITWKHEGWSGERVARALCGIITANHANYLYREARIEHDMQEIFNGVSHG